MLIITFHLSGVDIRNETNYSLTKLNLFNKEFCSLQNWRNFAILGLILKRVLLLHSVCKGI